MVSLEAKVPATVTTSPRRRIELDHAKYVPASDGQAGTYRCTACILIPQRFRPVEYDMVIVQSQPWRRAIDAFTPTSKFC
jgi:hypothetical protein